MSDNDLKANLCIFFLAISLLPVFPTLSASAAAEVGTIAL
jgi:hypothetical protein